MGSRTGTGEEAEGRVPQPVPFSPVGSPCWAEESPGLVLEWRRDDDGVWWAFVAVWLRSDQVSPRTTE